MENKNQNLLDESLYEQFEYRLVYLLPSAHAEERLTVGVVAMSNHGFELRLVSSVAALDLMTTLFGESRWSSFTLQRVSCVDRSVAGQLGVTRDAYRSVHRRGKS